MTRKAVESLSSSGETNNRCLIAGDNTVLRKDNKSVDIPESLPVGGVIGDSGGHVPPWHLKTNCHNPRMLSDWRTELEFKQYLKSTSQMTIDLKLYDMQKMEIVYLHLPYTHRWHEKYRNRTLARFYKFNDWWELQGKPPLTLLTLTTYQDGKYSRDQVGGYTIGESFSVLKASWDKLRKMLRGRIICHPFDYLWTLEPHLTGYPHMHIAIIGTLDDIQKEKVKTLWCDDYNAGSYQHGAQFEDSCLDAKGDIKNAGFYLFKYLGKSFCISPDDMTPGELKFNTELWKNGWRQWGSSRGIGRAMKLDYQEKDRFRFLEAGVSMPGWQKTFREATDKQKWDIRKEIVARRNEIYEIEIK